jgi:DNA-binding winged helix-turn-helix (wHTH) protein
MRVIGHEILLSAGDSISRVLPITHQGNCYQISFERTFELNPDDLAVNSIKAVEQTDLSENFLVEVFKCRSQEVVYSFEFGNDIDSGNVACRGRILPNACYSIKITILDYHDESLADKGESKGSTSATSYLIYLLIIPLILSFLFFRRNKPKPNEDEANEYLIKIGAFKFDKRSMILTHNNSNTELTGKEADLLSLLHLRANSTVERTIILEKVWGDEGDYIGRTLDVFISRLRKKLEADKRIKIINIRGVGYKIVTGDDSTGEDL